MDHRAKLKEYVDEIGGCTAAAKWLGCRPITLWKVIAGTRGVSRRMAKKWESASGGRLCAAEFSLAEPVADHEPKSAKRKPREAGRHGKGGTRHVRGGRK